MLRPSRDDVRTAAGVVGVLLLIGIPAGLLWWWVAPQPLYRVAAEGLYLAGSQPQAAVAADGWFLIITGAIGVVAGVVVWLRCRQAPLGALLGLFIGGLAGAALAASIGLLLGREDPFAAAIGTLTDGSLEIRAWGVVLAEAGFAVVVWLLLDLLVLREEPTADPAPDGDAGTDPEGASVGDALPADGRPDYGAVRDL
jgi:hypothetical protein